MHVIENKTNTSFGSATRHLIRFYRIGKAAPGIRKPGEKVKLKYPSNHMLMTCPTSNCQMSTLSSVEGFLGAREHSDDDIAEVFRQLQDVVATRCLLIDIEEWMVEKLKRALKLVDYTDIVFETPYENTTGTDMCLVYIDMNTRRGEEDEDEDDEYWDEDDY
jgi:hypothetical protein